MFYIRGLASFLQNLRFYKVCLFSLIMQIFLISISHFKYDLRNLLFRSSLRACWNFAAFSATPTYVKYSSAGIKCFFRVVLSSQVLKQEQVSISVSSASVWAKKYSSPFWLICAIWQEKPSDASVVSWINAKWYGHEREVAVLSVA